MNNRGSISKVMVDENDIAVSSAYDYTMMIWDLTTKKEVQKLFGPHKQPILDFDWHNSLIASGDKNGTVVLWVSLKNYYFCF